MYRSILRTFILGLAATLTVLPAPVLAAKGGNGGGKGGKACHPHRGCDQADTSAPWVGFVDPTNGESLTGPITAWGTANDDTGVTTVEVRVDDGAWRTASGTSTWSIAIDTAAYADGAHRLTARARDAAGNASTDIVDVTFSNAPAPEPTPTPTPPPEPTPTPEPTPDPGDDPYHLVTPEGTTITIEGQSRQFWTITQIHRMLKENGLDARIGPTLTVRVQDVYPSSVSSSASTSNGVYTSFRATMYLRGTNSTFQTQPNAQIGHEYGHVWSLYHLYLSQNGDWSSYLSARGLTGHPKLDSSYTWSRTEIIADDYRLLFGSSAAIAERPRHMNAELPDPRDVPGLRNFLSTTWAR